MNYYKFTPQGIPVAPKGLSMEEEVSWYRCYKRDKQLGFAWQGGFPYKRRPQLLTSTLSSINELVSRIRTAEHAEQVLHALWNLEWQINGEVQDSYNYTSEQERELSKIEEAELAVLAKFDTLTLNN